MIREISTFVVVALMLAFMVWILFPPFFHAYNWMSQNQQFPSNSSYSHLQNFISFMFNNIHWIIILVVIALIAVYVTTRGNVDLMGG